MYIISQLTVVIEYDTPAGLTLDIIVNGSGKMEG
jgi:hypothetical protein